MLLIDDDDQLAAEPSDGEKALADTLGAAGLQSVDEAIQKATQQRWLKVARVVIDAIKAGGYSTEEERVQLYVRRVIALVNLGALESQGNLRRPRFSEVKHPVASKS